MLTEKEKKWLVGCTDPTRDSTKYIYINQWIDRKIAVALNGYRMNVLFIDRDSDDLLVGRKYDADLNLVEETNFPNYQRAIDKFYLETPYELNFDFRTAVNIAFQGCVQSSWKFNIKRIAPKYMGRTYSQDVIIYLNELEERKRFIEYGGTLCKFTTRSTFMSCMQQIYNSTVQIYKLRCDDIHDNAWNMLSSYFLNYFLDKKFVMANSYKLDDKQMTAEPIFPVYNVITCVQPSFVAQSISIGKISRVRLMDNVMMLNHYNKNTTNIGFSIIMGVI